MKITHENNAIIENVSFNSNNVSKNSLFVAIKGTVRDGHKHIPTAIKKGATVIVYDDSSTNTINDNVTWVKVKNSSLALGIIAHNYYDNPSSKLNVIGITGTNGKTTTATLLFQSLQLLGQKVGLFSTVCNYINDTKIEATHTTPDALQIATLMNEMVKNGCKWVVMEVSSHALKQHRTAGINFRGAIFTNITHDHLDYHSDFNDYIYTKKTLFDALDNTSFALVNKDSKHHSIITQNTNANTYSYSLKTVADYNAKIIDNALEGLELEIDNQNIWFRLAGQFNAYNIIAVYATLLLTGYNSQETLKHLSSLEPINGRFQVYRSPENKIGIIDYCHTPDALDKVLETIQSIRQNDNIITVFGCGGNRDKEKRPVMTKIAVKYSNTVIITADNPRNEKLDSIINDMLKGIDPTEKKKILTINNRQKAIKTATMIAKNTDIVLVAGKGHETYQEINGTKEEFNDMEYLKKYL